MVDVNLNDPAVQRLMGTGSQSVVMPGSSQAKVMTQVAGDEDQGFTSTKYLNRGKQEVGVIVRPRNSITMIAGVATIDVYALPGEPVKLHLICPKCKHTLTVDGNKKAIDWRPTEPGPHARALREVLPAEHRYLADNLGVLSVHQFQCTWETEDDKQDNQKEVGIISGRHLCKFKGVIERNILREI